VTDFKVAIRPMKLAKNPLEISNDEAKVSVRMTEKWQTENKPRDEPHHSGGFIGRGRRFYRLGPGPIPPIPVIRPPPAFRLCRTIISAASAAARRSYIANVSRIEMFKEID
jgi:hypothetical protein